MKSKNIIYLATGYAKIENYKNITYNDLIVRRDLVCDMLAVDLSNFDIIIASPPCNYWSKANYRREASEYSQKTKHLLPEILQKLTALNKPFIVENVINKKLMGNIIKNFKGFYYEHGRHCYFTNVMFNPSGIYQKKEYIEQISTKKRQGGENVNIIIEHFLDTVSPGN